LLTPILANIVRPPFDRTSPQSRKVLLDKGIDRFLCAPSGSVAG
jgi:hypothetical protein